MTKTLESDVERTKPRFDEVSFDGVSSVVQPEPDRDSPIAKLSDEKRCLGGIVFLAESYRNAAA
ncbi:hypothetical protein C491_13037 [Natronococcus amylolyticus DSM 10524]|uniref:Uncharacterized protein n=1 Tax=Natronococcus amylolyticus DSM 10524 TaxID=1227497 RepID=L9X437_9EURY|nr:hypothetical protein C491_13037 [Natronococcus amylolyticus DSM 10524]